MTVAERPTDDDGDASLLNKDTFCFTITTCQPVYNHYPPTALRNVMVEQASSTCGKSSFQQIQVRHNV